MAGISERPWFRKFLVSLVGKPLLKRFTKVNRDLRGAQEAVLQRIVETSRNTVFGREHGFESIKNIDDYRRAVPVGDFEDHRPYVDRMCNGESDILFPGRPLFYNTTSGTTSKPKLIPVSAEYFSNAYTGLTRLWLYSCLKDNPDIYNGKSLSAVAAAEEGRVADGTPYGSISGMVYQNIPNVLKSTHSTPYPVVCIKDYQKKYYTMMRFALPANITIIISPSPSNQLRFHQTVTENYSDLVRDIHDGTLRADAASALPSEGREETLARLKPNPGRAAQLDRLMSTHGEALRPKHYWPNLALVNTWKQGNFAQLLPQLDDYYPEKTPIRAFGYQASEARAGLVFGNDWDYSVLASHIYHFEFIEESARSQENPPTLPAHELEIGKRYYILFSNGSGLYRYDINDIVEVVGSYNSTPAFRFIQKGEGITSLTGEKLSEEQVMQAVNEVRDEEGIGVEFFTMACDEVELCYKFFVEFSPGVADPARGALVAALDRRLRKLNPEYEVKRGSNRLAAPEMRELRPRSRESLKQLLVAGDLAREGQYKEVYLTGKRQLLDCLEQLSAAS